MLLIAHPPAPRRVAEIDPSTIERKDLVFLPPASVIRQLVPRKAPAIPASPVPRPPAPRPTPPPPDQGKDRISVGPPSDLRTKGPIILRREDDLTKAPKGQPSPPAPLPTPPPAAPAPAASAGTAVAQPGSRGADVPGREGLRLPPGLTGSMPRGDEGVRSRPGTLGSSIPGAVDGAVRRLERDAQLGIPSGNGQNQAGFFFDPQGADFTVWLSHAKDELYRNWVIPQTALLGFSGQADFEVVLERDGTISSLRLVRPSGTSSLDRAAQNALTGSRFMPLPEDYRPRRLPFLISFLYGVRPQGG